MKDRCVSDDKEKKKKIAVLLLMLELQDGLTSDETDGWMNDSELDEHFRKRRGERYDLWRIR